MSVISNFLLPEEIFTSTSEFILKITHANHQVSGMQVSSSRAGRIAKMDVPSWRSAGYISPCGLGTTTLSIKSQHPRSIVCTMPQFCILYHTSDSETSELNYISEADLLHARSRGGSCHSAAVSLHVDQIGQLDRRLDRIGARHVPEDGRPSLL